MNTKNYKSKILTLAALALLPLGIAEAGSTHKVVRDGDGDIVTTKKDGSCVRTTDEKGLDTCAKKKTVLSQSEKYVYFDFDKSELTEKTKESLNLLAHKLKNAKDIKSATIIGHTDHFGTDKYNKTLSKERAKAVKKYLASQGYVNTSVAFVDGKGEKKPIVDCEKNQKFKSEVNCLQPNRRVELKLIYTKEHYSKTE